MGEFVTVTWFNL